MLKKNSNKLPKTIKDIGGVSFRWLDVCKPTLNTTRELKRLYPFLEEDDLRTILPPFERSKMTERENYIFLVLLYPRYDQLTKAIRTSEVDFFIGHDFLIVCHDGQLSEIARQTSRNNPHATPAGITLDIIHDLTVSRFALLKDINNLLIGIEEKIFSSNDAGLIRNILRSRSDILSFRECIQGHAPTLRKLTQRGGRIVDTESVTYTIDDVITHIDDIWGYLQVDRDTANALYDSHMSLVTMETNRTMQRLTGMSFIVFPTTLIATIFAMRAEHMPIVGTQYDFWIMLSIVISVMIGLFSLMRWKKWL